MQRVLRSAPTRNARKTLYKTGEGHRDQECCEMRWEWEHVDPDLGVNYFSIPAGFVKNKLPRIVVLNDIAREVVEKVRGRHSEYVFPNSRNGRISQMSNRTWREARTRAARKFPRLAKVSAHYLKHTFGERLRAADVPMEDRKDLLGHKSGLSMTTHYSAPRLEKLIEYANRVVPEPKF
ncbi:MAG: tyrosine-type recombinase/integrase [Nitrospinae bacterium]|nr:tyrosine-type recombinase/integrase [Nitrospinota bacterium]